LPDLSNVLFGSILSKAAARQVSLTQGLFAVQKVPKTLDDLNAQRAFTVREFCRLHSISVAIYYAFKQQGLGPREIRQGTTVLISAESAAAWREARSNPTGAEAATVATQAAKLAERAKRAVKGRAAVAAE
jgi:hypothetical protein